MECSKWSIAASRSALSRLGYDSREVQEIVEYIDREATIEGAPGLADEHLPVFDCAFKAAKGTRTIAPEGHIRMMGAVQPFISGAISKTVNMPTDTTVDEVESAYMLAWKLGVKALAIYRDGCKRTQPLNTSLGADKAEASPRGRSDSAGDRRGRSAAGASPTPG